MHPLKNLASLHPFFDDIADRRIVMLGEASHGTHEYYTWRTAITKRLVQEKKFQFIAVEGDWPDCYRINRYVKGAKDAGTSIAEVLKTFDRWPTWMWANWEVAALGEWLKEYNEPLPMDKKVGFYGLDVYSLWDSMKVMIDYLDKEDKHAAQTARKAIACFEPFNENEQQYARYTLNNYNCRDEVVTLLKEIRLKSQFLDGDREAGFNTEQNALTIVNAEKYYRSMINFNNSSWNIRDGHMMDTLDRLLQFHGSESKGIVWEHNTHVGDARATDMAAAGIINIGQLAREKYNDDNVYLTGFGCYSGTVMAGEEWGAPMKEMEVPAAKQKSIEYILHHDHGNNCFLLFNEENDKLFKSRVDHRAIGVVYEPSDEKNSNYVPTVLSKRYNAFIYFDKTKALHPLHLPPHDEKIPETYPFGI